MDNFISFPLLNPVHLAKRNLDYGDKYNFLDLHKVLHNERILSFQDKRPYFQPWQTSDKIILQWNSNYGPFTLQLIDKDENVVVTGQVSQLNNNWFIAPVYGYMGVIDLNGIDDGIYYVRMLIGTSGSQLELISSPLDVKENHKNTLLLKYNNGYNNWDCIFQNSEYFELRVHGILDEFTPQSTDTMFIDEGESIVKLRSEVFYKYKLVIGNFKGVPDKIIENINHIFKCSDILIDEIPYEKADGAKFERTGDKFVATSGWSIDVRPAKNRNSIRFENNIPNDNKVTVMYDVSTTFFGSLVPNSGSILIKTD